MLPRVDGFARVCDYLRLGTNIPMFTQFKMCIHTLGLKKSMRLRKS